MKIKVIELYFSGCSKEFSNRKCGMAGLVGSRFFTGCGSNRSVFVDVPKVIAQKRTG
jgi:hypothetical protein